MNFNCAIESLRSTIILFQPKNSAISTSVGLVSAFVDRINWIFMSKANFLRLSSDQVILLANYRLVFTKPFRRSCCCKSLIRKLGKTFPFHPKSDEAVKLEKVFYVPFREDFLLIPLENKLLFTNLVAFHSRSRLPLFLLTKCELLRL